MLVWPFHFCIIHISLPKIVPMSLQGHWLLNRAFPPVVMCSNVDLITRPVASVWSTDSKGQTGTDIHLQYKRIIYGIYINFHGPSTAPRQFFKIILKMGLFAANATTSANVPVIWEFVHMTIQFLTWWLVEVKGGLFDKVYHLWHRFIEQISPLNVHSPKIQNIHYLTTDC